MGQKRRAMTWPEYLSWVVGDDKQIDVSAKTGIDQGTVSRWRREPNPKVSAHSARCLALGYGRPVLEAFVVAGFLTEAEAGMKTPEIIGLDEVTNEQLAAEVKRRLLSLTERAVAARVTAWRSTI